MGDYADEEVGFWSGRDYYENNEVPEVKNKVDFNRVVLIIRHCSGAGSSTFANYLQYIHMFGNSKSSVVICEADDAMYEDGEYNFKPEKLGWAHNQCREKFRAAVENHTNLVICSNTNTKDGDVKVYLDIAKKYGYTCFVIVMENRNETRNSHNVPKETLTRQHNQLKGSIKLI